MSYKMVSQAADLLLKCAGYLDDRDSASQKGNLHYDTYYAIDTDVISLYLQPSSNSDYLDVFEEGPNSPTAKSLAFLLGDFLLASSEPLIPDFTKQKCRFLIIPPHDDELLRVLTAIYRKLSSTLEVLSENIFKGLSDIFTAYEMNRDDQLLLKGLKYHVPELVELFNPYLGPKAALMRYALLPDTTSQLIGTYLEDGFTFPLLDPMHNSSDRAIANDLIAQWKTRLKKKKAPQQPEYALMNDAEVLATIEYLNLNLRPEKKQIVIVTGSNYLFEAAGDYRLWQDDTRTFAELYLRHPQAFLAHVKFSWPSDSNNPPFNLIEWLNLFFPSGLRPSIQPLGTVVRHLLRSVRNSKDRGLNRIIQFLMDEDVQPIMLLEGWQKQVASAAKMQYADGLEMAEVRGATQLANELTKLRTGSGWSVCKLRELIFKESIGSISSLYSSTVWVGLWGQAIRQQSKAVPALRYDKVDQVVEDYSDSVVKLQLENAGQPISMPDLGKLRELNQKVEEIDPSLYYAHLIHALAFAAKGHWYATSTLANTAITICDYMDPSERDSRRGREPAYLACIAARRSATSRSAIDDATKYLEQAIKRENEGRPEDIRFTAERLILKTRYYYFDFFLGPKNLEIEDVISTIKRLYLVSHEAQNESNIRIRSWVQRQTLTHMFMLLIIAIDLNVTDKLSRIVDVIQGLSTFESALKAVSTHYHKPEDDPYGHLIFTVSKSIWDSDLDVRISCRNQAHHDLSKWDKYFMPYDKMRCEFLKRILTAESV